MDILQRPCMPDLESLASFSYPKVDELPGLSIVERPAPMFCFIEIENRSVFDLNSFYYLFHHFILSLKATGRVLKANRQQLNANGPPTAIHNPQTPISKSVKFFFYPHIEQSKIILDRIFRIKIPEIFRQFFHRQPITFISLQDP